MKVPVRAFESCPPLNDSNYPMSFEYAKLNLPQQAPAQVPRRVSRPPQMHAHISQSVNIHSGHSHAPQNSSGPNISNLDLKNKDSVIKTYKMLFPGGRAINPKVVSYQAPLAKILKTQFNIDVSHL